MTEKPQKNLVQVNPTPDQRRLAKLRRVDVDRNCNINSRSPLPSPTINNNRPITWDTNAVKNLIAKAMEAAQDVMTTLTPMQITQLVRSFLSPPPTNTVTEEATEETVPKIRKKEEGTPYCPFAH